MTFGLSLRFQTPTFLGSGGREIGDAEGSLAEGFGESRMILRLWQRKIWGLRLKGAPFPAPTAHEETTTEKPHLPLPAPS